MGKVFVAQRAGSSQLCVLKLLSTEHRDNSAVAARFRREAHLLSLMNHPHISRVLDAGAVEGSFYIALEYIGGQTLAAIRRMQQKKGGTLPPELIAIIGVDVLDGLSYAHGYRSDDGHSIDLVHRDLSPNNIMVSYSGETKIIDFGIASSSIDDFRTSPGRILGTARYLSPEQARGQQVDHRSDLYTTAVVLWELFAFQLLVQKGPAGQVLKDIIKTPAAPLEQLIPGFPRSIAKVIARGLQKDRSRRWQEADAFREALLQAATQEWNLPSRSEMGRMIAALFPKGRKINDLVEAYAEEQQRLNEDSPYYELTGHDDAPLGIRATTPLPEDSTASELPLPGHQGASVLDPLESDPTINAAQFAERAVVQQRTGEQDTELVSPTPLEFLDSQDSIAPTKLGEPKTVAEGVDHNPTRRLEGAAPEPEPPSLGQVVPAPDIKELNGGIVEGMGGASEDPAKVGAGYSQVPSTVPMASLDAPLGKGGESSIYKVDSALEDRLKAEFEEHSEPRPVTRMPQSREATDSLEQTEAAPNILLWVIIAISVAAGVAAGVIFAVFGP